MPDSGIGEALAQASDTLGGTKVPGDAIQSRGLGRPQRRSVRHEHLGLDHGVRAAARAQRAVHRLRRGRGSERGLWGRRPHRHRDLLRRCLLRHAGYRAQTMRQRARKPPSGATTRSRSRRLHRFTTAASEGWRDVGLGWRELRTTPVLIWIGVVPPQNEERNPRSRA
eukprot:scaffold3319_cov258-Pinguiococcus_pyrenoidosus.AAC.1